MRFSLIHLDDEDRSDEVFRVVPGGPEETVLAVPVVGLGLFLPILAKAWPDLPKACCETC